MPRDYTHLYTHFRVTPLQHAWAAFSVAMPNRDAVPGTAQWATTVSVEPPASLVCVRLLQPITSGSYLGSYATCLSIEMCYSA